jgi:hypothetical protein
LLQLLDVPAPVGQAGGHAPAQMDDVDLFVGGYSRGVVAFALLGLNRALGQHMGAGQLRTQVVHLLADVMDTRQLFGSDHPLAHHRLVDQFSSRVGGGGDPITPAELKRTGEVRRHRLRANLIGRQRLKIRGLQSEASLSALRRAIGLARRINPWWR